MNYKKSSHNRCHKCFIIHRKERQREYSKEWFKNKYYNDKDFRECRLDSWRKWYNKRKKEMLDVKVKLEVKKLHGH
jgi:hypothetical protein